jgi:hypothetical protein
MVPVFAGSRFCQWQKQRVGYAEPPWYTPAHENINLTHPSLVARLNLAARFHTHEY